jgi:hypothetical protein
MALSAAAACSISVDLPMPGSPPIKVTDPNTSPPPSTRSSSAEPVAIRGCSARASAAREVDESERMRGAPGFGWRTPDGAVSPTNVFHSPQAAHCPCHLGEAAPQFWQTNTSFSLRIAPH